MGEQLTDNPAALGMFFTEDIYLVGGEGVVTSAEPVAVVPALETAKRVFKYLGKNQKNVLIVVNDDQNDVSSDRGKELLRNIVKAIQLSANDFALLNYSGYEGTSFVELTDHFSSKLVMVFGVEPARLGITENPKHVIFMESAIQVVFSDNLDLLAEDQNGKKTLWGSIKKLSI